MLRLLQWVGRTGRYWLIVGLVVGLALPEITLLVRPWIGELIAALLVVTAVRVGARAALGSMGDVRSAFAAVGFLQIVLPLAVLAAVYAFGLLSVPLALVIALLLSAPSVTGAPNFVAMVGGDPAPGMRILILGTLLFPLTALPLLLVVDPLGGGVWASLRLAFVLLTVILGAVAVGFALRALVPSLGDERNRSALDGVAALLLAVVVVGLMSAIGPLLRSEPLTLLMWFIAAVVVNFGLQWITFTVLKNRRPDEALPVAVYSGNRNIALFLTVLPEQVAAPMMVFIGCYQIPMYLTPALVAKFNRALARAG
ncbi:hypothetical protein ACFQ14_02380 [Pseudahrensia aquimaris]|uniref:Bile acid:Na+ symporter, BASS family n=1 Tax=Pseudahrensia aquimaris TaxID=744461 RepID=A0ABW3F9V1_9HYPH